MKQGILYVVFGKEFERFAIDCLQHTVKNTKYPIHILTNMNPMSERWKQFDNMTFDVFDLPDEENRYIKTNAIHYTPFEETLMLDCDTVINKEISFDFIKGNDIVLRSLFYWDKGDKILRLYRNAFRLFGCHQPIHIFCGAYVMFRINKRTINFFDRWYKYWVDFGKWREMPCLCCAVQNSKLKVGYLPDKEFEPQEWIEGCTIQHDTVLFSDKYNIKPLVKLNALDPDPKLWNWVEYE